MVVQSDHVLAHLRTHRGQEGGVARLGTTREHELLPDHHAHAVILVLEFVGQLVAPTPQAEHVLVRGDGQVGQPLELRERDAVLERVHGHHVRAPREEGHVVD